MYLYNFIDKNSTNEAIVGRWIAKRSSLHWTEGIIYRFPFENEKIQKVQEEIHQDYSKKFELVVERIAIKALEKEVDKLYEKLNEYGIDY